MNTFDFITTCMWRSFTTRSLVCNPKVHAEASAPPPPPLMPRAGPPSSVATPAAATRDPAAAGALHAYRPGRWDIWMLGISIGLGGQYFSWNDGLRGGLYSFLLIYAVVGSAYIALCCCTSEITGALPFAGGAYGLSRCTLGFYAGFIVGCAETLEYIVYVGTSVIALARMLVESVPEIAGYEPLVWMLIYTSALAIHIRGDYVFWRWNVLIGVISLFFVLLYCIGSFPHADFAANADDDPAFRFVNGFAGFMRSLPLSCWFFVGVEALSLASDDVLEPKKAIPFAQVACIVSLFVSGVVVLLVTVSLPPPGVNHIAKLLAPFDNGYQLLFDISVETATLFSIPAMYATTFGFMWGYGKLIAAMATSKLLPPILARPHPKYGTPYLAIVSGSVLSYFVSVFMHYTPAVTDRYIFNICITMAFLGYAAQCVGYIALKKNYPNIKSSAFRSPFGIYGALYSLLVWILGLVSIAFFQENDGIEISVFLAIILVISVFYLAYAKSRQTLSSKEHKVFLMAHVMKFNKDKSRRKQYASDVSGHQPRPSGSPTRLMAATTSLVRPALSLHQLQLGRSHSLTQILKLPVVLPLAHATPFHRQFTSPRPSNPYGDDSTHELRNASSPVVSDFAASVVEMLVAGTDDARLNTRSLSFPLASPRAEKSPSNTGDHAGTMATPTEEKNRKNGDRASQEADEHSEIYRDDGRKFDSGPALLTSPSERSAWNDLGLRYSTLSANVGFVNHPESDPASPLDNENEDESASRKSERNPSGVRRSHGEERDSEE